MLESIKKVLLIEDDQKIADLIILRLGRTSKILLASTIREAFKKFEENPDIIIIIMDYWMPINTGKPANKNTLELVAFIRKKFKGPIIATSNDPQCNRKLMEAGCNYKCDDKLEIPDNFFEIIRRI